MEWNKLSNALLEKNHIKLPIEKRFFLSFLEEDEEHCIQKKKIISEIKSAGFKENDPRISGLYHKINSLIQGNTIQFEEFSYCIENHISVLSKILRRELIIHNFPKFCSHIDDIYNKILPLQGGKVADYIPQLSRVNPDQCGVSICSIDGQRYDIGDTHTNFSIQSCCKTINYGIILEDLGEDVVHSYIGREPSGQSFNELTLNKKGLPHNPLINSGAIMASSLIKQNLQPSERFEYVIQIWEELCGGICKIGFNNPVYLSEKKTADRNYALAYFMKEKNDNKQRGFPETTNLEETLELYFQCCSIEMNTEALSIVASTLANGGMNPFSGKRVFSSKTVNHILSMMLMCGMYDYSGEYAFKIGIPSKSGVAGAIMVVVPNVLGLAIWSPPLDEIGNSYRGIEFCKELGKQFNFHIFDTISNKDKIDPTENKYVSRKQNEFSELCLSAKRGDIEYLRILFNQGIDMEQSDYDGRTALHLAVCEKNKEIVSFLINVCKVSQRKKDRWGKTPKDEAIYLQETEIISYFD